MPLRGTAATTLFCFSSVRGAAARIDDRDSISRSYGRVTNVLRNREKKAIGSRERARARTQAVVEYGMFGGILSLDV